MVEVPAAVDRVARAGKQDPPCCAFFGDFPQSESQGNFQLKADPHAGVPTATCFACGRNTLENRMADKALIDEVRNMHLLSALNEEQLARIAGHATRMKLHQRQIIFSQGDLADRFFLVLKGQIRLFRLSREGTEKTIEIVAPGQTFAEALMFLSVPRFPVCAESLSLAEVVSIDSRDFALMLQDSVETCFVLLGAMSQRLHGLIGEIDSITLHTASSRFARYLLKTLRGKGCVLDLNVPKMVIASRISITPETFSRVEKKLSDRDIIEVHGSRVTILDYKALVEVAMLDDLLEFFSMPCTPATGRTTDDLDTE